MKVCTLLICCVLLGQNVFGENDYNPEEIKTSQHPNPTKEPRTPPDFSGTQSFSSKLYEAVKESQPQNFVLSPLSLTNALAMVGLGARGGTAEEIRRSLGVNSNNELIDAQSELILALKGISSGNSSVKFVSADKIYAKFGLRLNYQYKNNVTGLGGEIETVDFGKSEEAARKINLWVQKKTEGKIEKLVEASDLSSQTSLFVLNTIYFKGSWENKFENSSTKQRPFSINASCKVNVSMMFQKNEFQLAKLEDAKARVLRLPYQGERLSMLIYLPNKNKTEPSSISLDTLENWLKEQSPSDIQKLLNRKRIIEVSVSLPKFKIRSSLDLNEPLKNLGLRKMFDQAKADFRGIFDNFGNLFVSKVSQETFIEVNEEGTEAAAATGFGLSATSFSSTPEFKVDRPFLFQIVDSETKAVLFSGRVKNPLDFGESTASAGQTKESTCLNSKETESTNTNTNTRNNIDTAGNGTNDSCQGNLTSEVEKLFNDFCNFTSSSNSTAELKNNLTTPIARLEHCLKGQAAERAQIKLNQDLTQTVNNRESRVKEFEPDERQRQETDLFSISGEMTGTSASTVKPCQEKQGNPLSFPPAAAFGFYWGNQNHDRPAWKYNSTTDGPCVRINKATVSIFVKGSSCVALYPDENCTKEDFQMSITKSALAEDIEIPYKIGKASTFIGVCSSMLL